MREKFDQYGSKEQCRLKLCLDFTLYYEGGFKANAEGILHFYRESLEHIREHVNFYATDGRRKLRRVRQETFEMLPFWASDEAAPRPIYGLMLTSGKTAEDASDRSFQMYDDGGDPGYVRLLLPLEFINQGVADYIALVKSLASRLKFHSGYAGYGVNIDQDYPESMQNGVVYTLSRRYRGVEFGRPHMFASFLREGIKSVNWLTFLGERFIDELGGRKSLESKLGEGMTMHELPHGVVIQAGAEPDFGDVNRQQTLPLYRQVGALLKDVRFPSTILREYNGIGGTENTEEWLARFDG